MKFQVKFKWVGRKAPGIFRLCRIMWNRGRLGFGGYSAKLSMALVPWFFRVRRQWREWEVVVLGIRVHYKRNYGGRYF